jgi:signal transduction histidine kinase
MPPFGGLARSVSAYAAAAWRICTRSDAIDASIRRTNDFLPILGHELRHRLAAIAASTALITRLGHADSNPAFRQIVDTLDRQCRYLSRLVDDLADLSRSNYSTLKLRMDDVELATIIDDAVHAVRGRIEDRAQQLLVSAPPGSTVLRADPVRLVQILINLLDNASKYTPDGGEIQLAVKRQETSVCVSVRNNGDGIPREKMAAILDPFVQIAPSRWRGECVGLGLALTERLVSLHGGTIRASSDGPGKGTEFVVHLPMTSGPPDTCLGRWDTSAAPH